MGAGIGPEWNSFFSAQIGASAALAGLIFVAVSINLSKIVASRRLAARAAKALCALTGILLICTISLVPGQPLRWLAWEIAGIGILVWLPVTWAGRVSHYQNPYLSPSRKAILATLTQASVLPMLAAGGLFAVRPTLGLGLLVTGICFSYVTALVDAWVLLIEIHR
jgi:hypothetical protein